MLERRSCGAAARHLRKSRFVMPHHRHRRPAQRRQEHPVQRADQERRARRELPVRDDRAERRRGRAARPAAGQARRDVRLAEDHPGAGVVRRHRRAGPRRVQGAGPGQRVPRQHPRRDARSARWCGPSPTRTWCTSTARSRPADDIETINTELILADLQTLEKALPRLEKEAKVRKDRAPVAAAAAAAAEAARRRHDAVRRARPGAGIDVGRAARAAPADHQAVPVRLQRRRGGAGQRGVPGRAARAGRAGRGGLHGRQDRVGADRPARGRGAGAAGVDRPVRARACTS